MNKNSIPLEEKFSFSSENQKENESNLKNEIIINSNFKEKNGHKKTKNINKISNKPQKRKRPQEMDIDEEDNINTNTNINKKKKVPLIKLVERINLNDPENAPLKNSENQIPKKKRGVKIFSDMSISEISNNLFKNYYPCVLPEYYQDQITEQIIQNQLDKLVSNFIADKKDEIKNKKIKINQNMDYLRQLAEKQGEWVEYNQNTDDKYQENEEEEKGYKSYDSNSENNSINSYPEDESVEQDDYEQDFGDKYDDYDNGDYGDEDY